MKSLSSEVAETVLPQIQCLLPWVWQEATICLSPSTLRVTFSDPACGRVRSGALCRCGLFGVEPSPIHFPKAQVAGSDVAPAIGAPLRGRRCHLQL
jgi:hypothetical protein